MAYQAYQDVRQDIKRSPRDCVYYNIRGELGRILKTWGSHVHVWKCDHDDDCDEYILLSKEGHQMPAKHTSDRQARWGLSYPQVEFISCASECLIVSDGTMEENSGGAHQFHKCEYVGI